jgi:hypothetical protein
MSTKQQQKVFESFLDKVSEFPFWIKEIIYIQLREEFEQAYLSEEELHAPIEESYQAYRPMLTFLGEQELANHTNLEDAPVYRFLQMTSENCSIAEITLRNFWTLENTAKIHLFCLQKEYLMKPTSPKVSATALYVAGRIKMGEYFRRIGLISTEELNTALRKQKEMEKNGKQVHFAEVLIKLGYITERETKAIIYIKDECKKRFIFNTAMIEKPDKIEKAQNVPLELKNLRRDIYELQTKLDKIKEIIEQ